MDGSDDVRFPGHGARFDIHKSDRGLTLRLGVTHRGERSERRFNPLWTRLDREHDEDWGLMALALVSRGERVVIASELSPPERADFADAFGEALSRAKRGP